MSENYLKDLFIDEVKGALKQGGGSGGTEKTKLSEFENDLWYSKVEEFLTINKEDFVPYYCLDDDGNPTDEVDHYYYKGTPALDWFKDNKSIGFISDWGGELYSHNVDDDNASSDDSFVESGYWLEDEEIGRWIYCGDCALRIVTGIDIQANDVESDCFYVQFWTDGISDTSFESVTIYKVDEKKVPIEYCDTSEIEAEIKSLIEEAYD